MSEPPDGAAHAERLAARRNARAKRNKAVVKEAVENALPIDPAAREAAQTGPFWIEMTGDGLFHYKSGALPRRVCAPFDVLAETFNPDADEYGLLLRFRDRRDRVVKVILTRDHFVGESMEVARTLAKRGLSIYPHRDTPNDLNIYLSNFVSGAHATIVSRSGWHEFDGARVFVLPEMTAGLAADLVMHEASLRRGKSPFSSAGTLADWQRVIAKPCVGNSRLVFAVSSAFAGPLLDLIGADGGVFHLRGNSRSGKSTVLSCAASVWGYAGSRTRSSFIRLWHSTAAGLEETAKLHSDTFLPLDELGTADPKEIGKILYFLSSGQGRIRGREVGGLRETAHFNLLALSTGEEGLADRMAAAGGRPRAGQELRLLEIEAIADEALGVFQDIHGASSPAEFQAGLKAAAGEAFGTAGPAFVSWLAAKIEREPDFGHEIARDVADLAEKWLAECSDPGGQVGSAARRFALVAIAGLLATEAGITDWPDVAAKKAAKQCFTAWLDGRGFTGAREDHQAVAQLRAFLQAHGKSRFDVWATDAGRQEDDHQGDRLPVANRAGWRKWEPVTAPDFDNPGKEKTGHAWVYYMSAGGDASAGGGDRPTGLRGALFGLNFRQAVAVLRKNGFIETAPNGRGAKVMRISGNGPQRVYPISPSLFYDDDTGG